MRRVKIFSDSDHEVIEQQVNKWLAGHATAVIFRTMQSECEIEGLWSLTITVFYYEGARGQ